MDFQDPTTEKAIQIENERKERRQLKGGFAKASLYMLLLNLFILVLFFFAILDASQGDETARMGVLFFIATPLGTLLVISLYLLGVIFAAVSLVKKEDRKVMAVVCGILNLFALVCVFVNQAKL